MTFNEINNQGANECAHHMLQEGAILTTDDNPKNQFMMYQSGINELVASAKAVQIGHEIDPENMIGCMIAFVPIYPATCNPRDMMEFTSANHRRYWFADVHCTGIIPGYLENTGKEKDIRLISAMKKKKISRKVQLTILASLTICLWQLHGMKAMITMNSLKETSLWKTMVLQVML